MRRYQFIRKQFLPIEIQEAWAFFSDPRNLVKITPATLDFKIISEVPDYVYNGLKVEYRVRPLLGIPIKWVSLIKDIKVNEQFVDEQLQGPYRYWHHFHHFYEVPKGVMMEDIIDYEIPFGNIFPWLNEAIVLKELDRIFDYRRETLMVLFGA